MLEPIYLLIILEPKKWNKNSKEFSTIEERKFSSVITTTKYIKYNTLIFLSHRLLNFQIFPHDTGGISSALMPLYFSLHAHGLLQCITNTHIYVCFGCLL